MLAFSIFTLHSLSLICAQKLNMLQHQNIFVLLSFLLTFLCHCSATQFIVGDSAGWVLPPYPTYYGNWSKSHLIRAGDSLEFDFDAKFYNLIQVSQSEYEHCTALEPLKVFNSSPVIFPFKERGVYFFICSVSNYCSLGQKIVISVHDRVPVINPPKPSQVPIISPQLPPNGSAPQPSGMSNPPSSTTTTTPPSEPSSNQGLENKFNLVAFVCSMVVVFLGFLVM